MKLLLDSHTLLWAIYEPQNLPPRVAQLLTDRSNSLYLSLASVWEIANKAAWHRLPLVGASLDEMLAICLTMGIEMLPITQADILASARLPRHHADPFDRVLIAQAVGRNLQLVTLDKDIMLYAVATVWA